MAIVPNGTRRTMIAQTFGRDPNIGLDSLSGMPDMGQQIPQDNQQPEQKVEQPQTEQIPEQPPEQQSNTDDDLTSYVINKLQEMGYPPRRVQEFEDKLIEEKIFPGDVREINIVLPDRYYGMKKRISGKDLAQIIKDVQAKFGLSFIDADRKEKKITMNFTSRKMETENNEEPVVDALEEVYGTPVNNTGKKKRNAKTIQELIKMSKLFLYEDLKKLGEKNENI